MKKRWLCMGAILCLPLQGFGELEEQPTAEVDCMGEFIMKEPCGIDPYNVDPSSIEDSCCMDPCHVDPSCLEDCYSYCPPVNPCIPYSACYSRWLLSSDFLYWQLRSEELPFAIENSPLNLGLNNSQTMKRVKPEFQPGVRLELDYVSPCFDGWDFCAQWTYFHSRKSADAQAIPGGTLYPIWVTPPSGGGNSTSTSAHATHNFTINIADFTLGRVFSVGRRLSLHPLAGVRGVWIDQNLKVDYFGGTLGTVLTDNKINCRGGGVRAGLDTEWELCYGFSLLARSNLNLLWSSFKVNQINRGPSINSIRDSICTIMPVVELFLGLVWERLFCNSSYYVNAHLGWEEQYFLNGIQFNQYTSYGNGIFPNSINVHQLGGLGLGGLTVGVTVGF